METEAPRNVPLAQVALQAIQLDLLHERERVRSKNTGKGRASSGQSLSMEGLLQFQEKAQLPLGQSYTRQSATAEAMLSSRYW